MSGVRLAWRAGPVLTVILVLALAAEAALLPVQLAFSRAVIDRAVTGGDMVAVALGAALALALAQILAPIASTAQSLAGDRLTAYVGGELIAAANSWPGLARFEDPGFQDDLHRSRNRAATGSLDVVVYGSRTVLSLFTVVVMAIVLVGLHPLAPLLVAATAIPNLRHQYEFVNRTGSHMYTQTPEARRLEYFRDVSLDPDPAKDVRLFGLGPFFRRRYDDSFDRTSVELQRLRRRLTPGVVLATALSATAVGAVYVFLVRQVARGDATVGDLVLYGGAAAVLQSRLANIAFDLGFLPDVLSFLPSLTRVLEAGPDLVVSPTPSRLTGSLRHGVVFENVSFAYPGREDRALDDVSFEVPSGSCVALVGHNGAGKTSIVKLLLRLYDPTEGRILLDGVDLRDLDPADLRRRLGVIFQDFVRYELTAGENIAMGHIEGVGDSEEAHDALRRAGGEGMLGVLPDGLATALGRQFGGRELSEGEWQKLALARALVRDSALLVLDEPTAALDAQSEYDLYCRFRDLTADRTTLLVSHRLSTARLADCIVVLSGGRVVEQGGHDELVAAGGQYARFFAVQAAQHLGVDPGLDT